jgi:hypothetical protein
MSVYSVYSQPVCDLCEACLRPNLRRGTSVTVWIRTESDLSVRDSTHELIPEDTRSTRMTLRSYDDLFGRPGPFVWGVSVPDTRALVKLS